MLQRCAILSYDEDKLLHNLSPTDNLHHASVLNTILRDLYLNNDKVLLLAIWAF